MARPVVAEARESEPEEELIPMSNESACTEAGDVADLDRVALVTLPGRADPVSNCFRPFRQGYPK